MRQLRGDAKQVRVGHGVGAGQVITKLAAGGAELLRDLC